MSGLQPHTVSGSTLSHGALPPWVEAGALLVLHAGTMPALGLATGLLAAVAAGAALAVRRPGPWRAG